MDFRNIKRFSLKAFLLLLILLFQTFNVQAFAQFYFVTVSTQWCFACKILKPVIEELKNEYGSHITFIELDPTSEESLAESIKIAEEYGISQFFNASRNAFPTVGILCTGSPIPEKVIVGANPKQVYKEILDKLLLSDPGICSSNGRPSIAVKGPDRPDEPAISGIQGARPQEATFSLDRPIEIGGSGRPSELSFWSVGQQIPLSAYFQYLVLPKCAGSNSILCSNGVSGGIKQTTSTSSPGQNDAPVFKPYDPNYTRNEKGLHL